MSLNVYSFAELLKLKPPTWLIEGIIPENGLIALFGQPGHGKTFIAIDMALAVATGRPWQGHKVQKGYVVYISAEGGAGLANRVGAWLIHNKIPKEEYQNILGRCVVSALQIHPDSTDLDEVLNSSVYNQEYLELQARGLEPDEESPPTFIVVDTLARCFVGDENQQEDMGNFVKGLDYLRLEHGATVMVVHHTNKGGYEERGSSAFRGACNTMMLSVLENQTDIELSCKKQKDGKEFEPLHYDLKLIKEWD